MGQWREGEDLAGTGSTALGTGSTASEESDPHVSQAGAARA